jgi:hypothetical protein
MKTALALIAMLLGLGFALDTTSCIPTACTTSSAGSGGASSAGAGGTSAGTAGSDCSDTSSSTVDAGATTCGQLSAVQACFSTFCAADGAGTPFCACFTKGYDLGAEPNCGCVTLDAAAFCAQAAANGLDGSSLDCSAATGAIATQCVDVQ